MAETLFVSFASKEDAERATGALMDHGLKSEDISLVAGGSEDQDADYGAKGGLHTGDTAYDAYGGVGQRRVETGSDRQPATVGGIVGGATSYRDTTPEDAEYAVERNRDEDDEDLSAKSGLSTTTPEDAGAGALAGAGIGAGIGALAALGSLFIPGVGLVVGGGALATALAGAAGTAAAGAVAGGATGYLMDLGVDADTAREYDETVRSGGAILSINLPSGDLDAAHAREILTKYNAVNVSPSARAM